MSGVALVVVLSAAAVTGWQWWQQHPPYGPEALDLKASLALVSHEAAKRALRGEPAPLAGPGDQLVLGRVSWRPREPQHGGTYAILLIDKRTDRKPRLAAIGPEPDTVGIGSGSILNQIPERYPAMAGAGAIVYPDGSARSNGSVVWATEDSSPVTFVALFRGGLEHPANNAGAPVAVSDLLLAVAYFGPDQQLFWAHRLKG